MELKIYPKNSILNISYSLIAILQVIMLYGISSNTTSIISMCTYLFFGLGLLMFATTIIATKNWPMRWRVLFVLLIYIYTLLQLVGARRTLKISALSYMLMLSVWPVASSIKLNDVSRKITAFMAFIQGAMLIFLSYSEYAYVLRNEYNSIVDSLTLGFPNPNQTAIIIYSTISILIIARENFKSKFFKFLVFGELVWLFYLLILTNARISIFAGFFIVFLDIYNKTKKKQFKFNENTKLFVLIMCILPQLFFWIYNLMYEYKIFADLEIFGKSLYSGRNTLYATILDRWKNHFFGNMKSFYFENSHNAALTILVNTGIVGYALYFMYTYMELKHLCQKENTDFLSIVVVLSYFVIGCAEAAILVSGSIYYVTFLTVCILSNNTKNEV